MNHPKIFNFRRRVMMKARRLNPSDKRLAEWLASLTKRQELISRMAMQGRSLILAVHGRIASTL
jgi:hypothetical protein